MKLALGLAVIAACTTPAAVKTNTPAPPPKTEPAHETSGLPAAPVPTQHKLHDAIEAPHAGVITQVALTPDGTTALTADELGGVRLWPLLDGTAEPRIVDLPASRQISIGRAPGGGFTLAALDEVGGIYIARLDAAARTLSHVTLGSDPAFTGMAMSDLGLVAWRADQTVVLLDDNGATKSQLGTEPRQRIVSIAVSHDKAIAILEKEATTRIVRWLTLQPSLAWGTTIDLGGDPGQDIALSPTANRYAVTRKDDRSATVQMIDVAKKKVIASTPVVSTTGGVDLGFLDDDVLAIGSFEGINWIDAALPMPVMSAVTKTSGARASTALAAGAGHAVTTQNGELVIATPAKTEFLGYDLVSPRFVEAAANGQLLIGLRDTFAFLDGKLQSIEPGPTVPNLNLTQLMWLGGNDWLVEQAAGNGTIQLTVADIVKNTQTVVRSGLKESNVLLYEPSTQLVTLSFGSVSEVAHFDAKKRSLDHISSLAKPSAYEQVLLAPIAPNLASGNQLVHIAMRASPTIKWVRDAHALDKTSASVTLDGSYAGTDAAGHVYMWRAAGGGTLELTIYADGKPIAVLPSQGPNSVWPDPTGKRVIEVGTNSIGLYSTTDGKRIWSQDLGAVQEALWLSDGALAISSAGGIARLDPVTGTVMSARCGWRFGLSSKPHPPTAHVEPLCAQLDR